MTTARAVRARLAVARTVLEGSGPGTLRGWIALFGLGPVVAVGVLEALVNAPGESAAAATLQSALRPAATLAPPAACLALALGTDRSGERVGLVFAGVFGLLATITDAVAVPAAGAVLVGGAVAVVAHLDRPAEYAAARGWVGPAAVFAGIAATLGAATGLLPWLAREIGTWLVLAGIAATPLLVETDWIDWGVGAVGGGAVLAWGASSPYVAGAVLLVAGGVVGAPLGLVALAVTGALAAVAAGFRSRSGPVVAGSVCLLAVGVPTSVGAAVPAVLAVAGIAGVSE